MTAEIEARVVEMRQAHPRWGPRTILDKAVYSFKEYATEVNALLTLRVGLA